MSRPFLEWLVRQRVLARPNIQLLDQTDVERLLTTPDGQQVIGVGVIRRADNHARQNLTADLVVDASGRGSASSKWLAALDYTLPEESLVKVGVGYATRLYRRRPGDLTGAEALMITPEGPREKRMGLIFPIEEDRWICTLGGWAGDHAPNDEAGFMAFAHSLPVPDLYHMLTRLEPISDIRLHKFPANLRRRYEKLTRFPEGFLVLGDAVCSFNPVYGQGMTSAAMQAEALDELLAGRDSLAGLWRPFFKKIAAVIDIPWQLAVGEDFRFRETEGQKAPGTDLINAYVAKVHRATHSDPVVYGAFLKVMNLMAPPTSLFKPNILWRVLGSKVKARPASRWQPAAQS
jgi:2-polyprenyl-6-methoxyphenol hydroxylase-like FAD-dependent oxidoreductase